MMKKIMTVFAIAICVSLTAPSCTQDDSFEEIVENSRLDETTANDREKDVVENPWGE